MSYLRNILRKLYVLALKQKLRKASARLENESGDISILLAKALRETVGNKTSTEENSWIEKIELLRHELSASQEKIIFTDFGAGSPDLQLCDGEMYQGRTATSTVGAICRGGSTPYFWSLFLFKLIREVRPRVCLELGTSLGLSAAYQGAALKLNRQGTLVSLEGAETLAFLAKRNSQKLGLDNIRVMIGRFQDTLDDALQQTGELDWIFIDGHHDEKATLAYFEKIFPFLSEQAVLVFDDISWSRGMKRAWKAIETDDRVMISLNLTKLGVCVVGSMSGAKLKF